MAMTYAFTSQYGGISSKLINTATLIYNKNEYVTDLAQWDTGATNTCISQRVVDKLGLVPVGKKDMQSALGRKTVNEYRIDIRLQNKDVYLPNIYVIDSDIGKQGIDVLIGMDIITQGDFSVSNYGGKTIFTFRTPSMACTDYVKLLNSKKQLKSQKIQPNDPCPCSSGQKYKRCCGRK